MACYAVVSMSGSVGKTTTVVSLAILLSQEGLRVRVIDIDSQANASTWLGHPEVSGSTVADVLRAQASIADAERAARRMVGYDADGVRQYEPIPGLTVLPAVRSVLDKVMIEISADHGGVLRLRDALATADPVDVTLIDGAGSFTPLVVASILAAAPPDDAIEIRRSDWGVITCTKPSGKENEGIPDLERELRQIKKIYRLDVPLLSIVPCAVPPRGHTYEEQLGDLRQGYGELVTPSVRRSIIVDEAYTNYVPPPIYGYRAKEVTDDYRAVLRYQQGRGMFCAG